ncbi:tetratricopeptide repeat protein [Pedobacter cryophilus]|uniref:MalT-like TPR region domain-containing protein n=1 Tax=Pedobacter cryophilus TaxID=2571271 RepID=A0A4U1C4K9_9SPHI|nr:hypothetical protein [Pedobacter cryophilus]TKC00323.1 hypothetical protein FA046_01180 [Pedobacter cryophilus]
MIKSYSVEQKSLITTAFKHPDFLIGDQLIDLDSKSFIITGADKLQLNIYLSGINNKHFIHFDTNFEGATTQKQLLAFTNFQKIKAINFCYQGLYSSAIANYNSALSGFKILKDTQNMASTSANLARLYFLKRDFTQSGAHNKTAITYYSLLKIKNQQINGLIFKAHLALLNGDFKTAENLILKNVLLLGVNKINEQKCYLELGKIYLKSKRYTEAKWFFIQSLTLAEKLNSKSSKIQSLLLLARVKNIIKDHSLALKDLNIVKMLLDKSSESYKQDLDFEMAQTYSYLQNRSGKK